MEKFTHFFIFSSSIVIAFLTIPGAQSANPCKPDSCDGIRSPQVRFPFRLRGRQPARCGYSPGFNLHCNSRNQTILTLPRSGEFIVDYIDYKSSVLFIDDPEFCLPRRSLNFSLAGSPFDTNRLSSFGILNCSNQGLRDGDLPMDTYSYVVLSCMSTRNMTVVAVADDLPASMVPAACQRLANASVPPWWKFSQLYWGTVGLREDFELRWSVPDCRRCESRGGLCGFKDDSGLEIGCSKSASGLPRGAKYAVIIGAGIPGLLCMIGLTCYTCSKIKTARQQRRRGIPFDQQLVVRSISGLDLPTIDSYPKTVLGRSRRLPNPNDDACSICLSDYLPEETLKSIPECNHYFHATCIDEWLKLNGSCPLCRKSPEFSSLPSPTTTITTTSSSSSSSSRSSSALDHHLPTPTTSSSSPSSPALDHQ